jgi:hypothetical protein
MRRQACACAPAYGEVRTRYDVRCMYRVPESLMKKWWWGALVLCALAGPGARAAEGPASGVGAGDSKAGAVWAEKLVLAKTIYGPVFAKISYADAKAEYEAARRKGGRARGTLSEAQFEAAKALIYESFADALTLEDLELQKLVAGTAVGQRVLGNIPRSFSGLPPLPLTRDQFTEADWQAFQTIVHANEKEFVAMNRRMRDFPAMFRKRLQERRAQAAVQRGDGAQK